MKQPKPFYEKMLLSLNIFANYFVGLKEKSYFCRRKND